MKKLMTFCFLNFLITISYGQDSLQGIKFLGKSWRPSSIQIILSRFSDEYNHDIHTNDLKAHATSSGQFISKPNLQSGAYAYGDGGTLLNFSFSFTPVSKKTNKVINTQEFRVGLSYYRNKNNSTYNQKTYALQGDTANRTSLSYTERMDEVAADFSYLLKTGNIFKRFNFYFGMGLGIGVNVYGTLNEKYSEELYVYQQTGFGYSQQLTVSESSIENNYKLRSAMNIRAAIPIGLNFNFNNGSGIFIEYKPAMYEQMDFHSKSMMRVQNSIGAGIRYSLK